MRICDVCGSKDETGQVVVKIQGPNTKNDATRTIDLCEKCERHAWVDSLLVGIKVIRKHATGDDAWPAGQAGPSAFPEDYFDDAY